MYRLVECPINSEADFERPFERKLSPENRVCSDGEPNSLVRI